MTFVFDAMLGQVAYWSTLPGADDNLIVVPLEAGGEADATLRQRTTLTDALGFSTEHDAGRLEADLVFVGDPYLPVGSAGLTLPNNGWLAPAAGPVASQALICYKPTAAATDDDIVPLVCVTMTDFAPDGVSDILKVFAPFFSAEDTSTTPTDGGTPPVTPPGDLDWDAGDLDG